MITNDIPSIKPRRKYVDVPVHKPERDNIPPEHQKIKKVYSANFTSRKHKHKCLSTDNIPNISEVIIEIPDKDFSLSTKISKKHLTKEIERLTQNNEDITAKFNELEDLSVKKILKLKEKINNLQNAYEDVINQNEIIKSQYSELHESYGEIYKQLELSKVCNQCDELREQIEKVDKETKQLRKVNNEVTEDLGMLKTVVFRLNVQLERYQEKLRKYNIEMDKYSHLQPQKFSSTDQFKEDEIINILSKDHRHTPISWGAVNSHTLGPLLDAYQDTINEKTEIIQNYEFEFSKFTGKIKEVIEENETLYKKLTVDDNCSAKLGVQLQSIRAELKLTKDQNDALIKKCAIKQDKIEEILKVYENKVEQMKRDYQVVHDEYIKLRTENASMKEKNKALIDSQDDFRNERQNYIPVSVHTASVNECKKWYEELKLQYENEKQKLKENIENLSKTINDLEKSKDLAKEKAYKAEKDQKKCEAKLLDLEHSLNEVQLSRSACRKQLHKAMCFAKDMVAEQETLLKALNQRQLENRAVKQIGSDMALRMDSLKNQLKDVQKSAWQEFSTVEQRIHEQADLIKTMKDDHSKEIEELQQIIAEQEEKIGKQKDDKHHVPISHYQLFKEKYK
ncbi:unnamed protein product [Ceutorhynchus assimilis]|uniref:Uncharacterized protein n=1 Tax=Ceutorhynchus assimilis TaxID=467358 RepID=A0A9N9MM61_9CUCU|nr:unnamed protein product [Ceutorhynchus assimilis]